MSRDATERGAIELIEQAGQLLRLAPAGLVAAYYVATLPFALGLLYFWADMSQSPFAAARCAEAALGVALLYGWMKCGQAVFVAGLKARLRGEAPPRWGAARLGRLAVVQTALQPTALFALPLAFLMMLPFGWVYAFYHLVTAVGDGEAGDPRALAQHAARLARLWPRQNHLLLLIFLGFGFFVFGNLLIAVVFLPELLRMFFGVETQFTLSGFHVFNTTLLATIGVLTWLCLGPLIKAVYALHAFYGDSIHSGDDLLAELKTRRDRAIGGMPVVVAAVVLLGLAFPGAAGHAGGGDTKETTRPLGAVEVREELPVETFEGSTREALDPARLDGAIQRVLQRREFVWRLPREKTPADLGLIGQALEALLNWTRRIGRGIGRAVDRFLEWLQDWLGLGRHRWSPSKPGGTGWLELTRLLLLGLLVVAVAALGLLAWRAWRQRRQRLLRARALPPPAPAVDVADENVGAEELPVEGWLREAQELIARGELRLALRALYLAGLAQLAARELLVLARAKSNREYARELRRRAHAAPGVTEAFAENVDVFESAWYGRHEVTAEILERVRTNLEDFREPVMEREGTR